MPAKYHRIPVRSHEALRAAMQEPPEQVENNYSKAQRIKVARAAATVKDMDMEDLNLQFRVAMAGITQEHTPTSKPKQPDRQRSRSDAKPPENCYPRNTPDPESSSGEDSVLGFSASKHPIQKDLRPFFDADEDDKHKEDVPKTPVQHFAEKDWEQLDSELPPHPVGGKEWEQQPVIYGVAHGRTPGLYLSKHDVKLQVVGYPSAVWGIFSARDRAQRFIEDEDPVSLYGQRFTPSRPELKQSIATCPPVINEFKSNRNHSYDIPRSGNSKMPLQAASKNDADATTKPDKTAYGDIRQYFQPSPAKPKSRKVDNDDKQLPRSQSKQKARDLTNNPHTKPVMVDLTAQSPV